MNDFENNDIFTSNNNVDFESTIDTYADWYDYRDIITRQDTIIENQNKIFDLANQGFTFISFVLIIFFIYILIKNMIRK